MDQIFDIIEKERVRQEGELELIASENYVSRQVLLANGSILTNKYSEGYPGKRYYAWQKYIDEIETLAIERAKALFWAEYANVQPHSGSPANIAVLQAVLKPGDTILSMSLDHGGHLSHWHPLNYSGIGYTIRSYGVELDTGIIDMEKVRALAIECQPKMIIAGFSAYSREVDWKSFRQIADEVGAILFGDISHTAGLIAGGQLANPVPLCDIVSTTTHKTLRWPRWAIIFSKSRFAPTLARAVFPGIQGGPHEHTIAAKAVALEEASRPGFREYAKATIDNAQYFSDRLVSRGYSVVSGWTDTHLFLVDTEKSRSVSWAVAEAALEEIGISVNKNMVPFDTRKPLDPSGIRIGTPAITTRRMWFAEIDEIVDIMDTRLSNLSDMDLVPVLRERVLTICKKFPIYE